MDYKNFKSIFILFIVKYLAEKLKMFLPVYMPDTTS